LAVLSPRVIDPTLSKRRTSPLENTGKTGVDTPLAETEHKPDGIGNNSELSDTLLVSCRISAVAISSCYRDPAGSPGAGQFAALPIANPRHTSEKFALYPLPPCQ
jgi:hypothetical protein